VGDSPGPPISLWCSAHGTVPWPFRSHEGSQGGREKSTSPQPRFREFLMDHAAAAAGRGGETNPLSSRHARRPDPPPALVRRGPDHRSDGPPPAAPGQQVVRLLEQLAAPLRGLPPPP